jgi:hypothetical protein
VALGAVAFLFAAPVLAGRDTNTAKTAVRCARAGALETVFPNATAAGFGTRSQIKRQGPREPFKDRKCRGWWTTYTGFRGTGATVDVGVMLFKTRRDALGGLAEGLGGPVQVLPNGVRVRTRTRRLQLTRSSFHSSATSLSHRPGSAHTTGLIPAELQPRHG